MKIKVLCEVNHNRENTEVERFQKFYHFHSATSVPAARKRAVAAALHYCHVQYPNAYEHGVRVVDIQETAQV